MHMAQLFDMIFEILKGLQYVVKLAKFIDWEAATKSSKT